ncbi:XRE family transcriptional regulator [Lactobacillus johnsonii]|uniref:helix-turn-helix domain-containing protein n=1 Tax=Lactobacillus johnsonii TaxID=33959 RepID=UPI0021A8CCFB|nr:helix-turn-helix transcriptional regulator [Lactobacillus johnsonii]MCT3341635.1 XRE family transcriptional regulator [Lactobacillus johnsonii]
MTTKNGYTIFSRIQEIANKRGMSIRQVALKSGFNSPNAIYRYKQGVSPRKTTLNAIADALNTTPEYLLGETDDWQKHETSNDTPLNTEEKEMLVMYRKYTDGMSAQKRQKLNNSLDSLMNSAQEILQNDRNNNENKK